MEFDVNDLVSRVVMKVYFMNGHVGIAEVEFFSSDATAETFELDRPVSPGQYVRLGLISNVAGDPSVPGEDVIQVDEVQVLAGCNAYGDDSALKNLNQYCVPSSPLLSQ